MVNEHPAKFSGHRHCDNGDMFLAYYVMLQDNIMKRLCDFTGGNPS